MTEKPNVEELANRIRRDIQHYNGAVPERVTIAWAGYLSALLEWGLLSIPDHHKLRELLPEIENSPVYDIMVGRDDA